MMRHSTRMAVALLGLLAVASSASAECGWVLWGDQYSAASAVEPVRWQRYFVYPSYGACWAQITELTAGIVHQPGSWTDTFQRWLGTGQYGANAIAHRYGDKAVIAAGDQYFHWTCYPDTVDPRGPKGK